MLAEDRKDDHNMRSSSAMPSPPTPDFESRNAVMHASHAKNRRCTSVPALGPNGVQHVIRKFEKSNNRKVSPYTPRGNVVTAHAVSGPYAKNPSTPPRRTGNRLSSPRAARTGHSASSPQAAGTAAIVGPQNSPFSLGVPDAPSTVLYGDNGSLASDRSSIRKARVQLELEQEEHRIALLEAKGRKMDLRKKLIDIDARSSARSRTSRNSVGNQLDHTIADQTLARAPEQVAHAGGGTVRDTVFVAPTRARSPQAAGAGGRHSNDAEMHTPQVPCVHHVYNQAYVANVGIDPVAASHAAVEVGYAMQSVAAQAAEIARAEVQREAEKRHEASQQALTATALAAHTKVVAELSTQRDRTVEAVRADASLRMAQRERGIFDQAREAVAQVEGGKRMAVATAQATIGELQQKYDSLLQELEDHQRQQTGLTQDLDAARQYVSKVHQDGANKDAALRISVNAEADAQIRLSAMASEVAKWQQVAERHRTLNAGAGSSSQFRMHSPY